MLDGYPPMERHREQKERKRLEDERDRDALTIKELRDEIAQLRRVIGQLNCTKGKAA